MTRAACAPLLLLLALLAPSPASASVTLFEHDGFRGRQETFYGDVPDLRGTVIGNDRATSVTVEPGCVARLYQRSYFRGRVIEVHSDEPHLGYTALGNDRASSLEIWCPRRTRYRPFHTRRDQPPRGARAVVLFHDVGFRGSAIEVSDSIPDLGYTALGNDSLSSVLVPRGCEAILYRDAGFRGRAVRLSYDEPDLGATAIGNDRVSSVEVHCRWR